MIIVEINISEGKNQNLIAEFEKTLNDLNIHVIDINFDPSHNRSVLTFKGNSDDLLSALEKISLLAIENIDMEKHRGNHPRLGAIDVVAFPAPMAFTNPSSVTLATASLLLVHFTSLSVASLKYIVV